MTMKMMLLPLETKLQELLLHLRLLMMTVNQRKNP
jgi:hypothetical protein